MVEESHTALFIAERQGGKLLKAFRFILVGYGPKSADSVSD